MKKNYFLALLLAIISSLPFLSQDLLITGVIDGPLSGGTPKALELYVVNDIPDLSIYGVESVTNGNPSGDAPEYTFPADQVSAGTFIYLESVSNLNATAFNTFLGFNSTYQNGVLSVNGDDPIKLYQNGVAIDVFGSVGTDGTGEAWEYLDGWAYRKNGSNASTTFSVSDWNFSGPNALDNESTNSTAVSPFPAGSFSVAASTTPELFIVGAVSSLDYFENNGPSSEGSFTISGSNLTANVNVTAPANFELSLASESAFTSSVNIPQVNGSVASTTVFVRLASGLSVNSYSGDVTISSTGASDKTLSIAGEVSPADAQISITAFLDSLDYLSSDGGPSNEEDFTISGLFLTNDVIINAPQGFEVSLTTEQGFGNSVAISPNSGTIAQTDVFVRLTAGLTVGSYSGAIVISSTGVSNQTIDVTGRVFGAPKKSIIISGVYDGPLTGGTPKGVELYVFNDIPDLSLFGLSSANNGGGSTAGSVEFTFPAVAVSAGTYIYVSSSETGFSDFFGFDPDYTSGSMGINGDDAVELYESGQIIDTFGDVNTDGSGEAWDFLDGWAYRNNNSQPSGQSFNLSEWTFSGINVFDGETTNSTSETPFPSKSFTGTLSTKNNSINGFTLYPNPVSNNQFTIGSSSSETKQVTIFNVIGKQVFTASFSGTSKTLHTPLSSGVYVLKVTEKGKVATQKLIVQ